MNIQKNKIGIVAIILIMGLATFAFLKSNKTENSSNLFEGWGKNEGGNEQKKDISDRVTIFDSESVHSIDLANGELRPANALEQRDFSEFAGLPKMGIDGNRYLQESNFLISQKSDLTILEISIYEADSNNFETVDPEKFLGTEEYTCKIVEKSCERTNLLSSVYDGLENSLQKSFSFVWTRWDSEINNLFATVFDAEGHYAQVFVCSVDQKKCSSIPENISAQWGIPSGFLSPSFDKIVTVKNTFSSENVISKQELLVFSINDLSKPLKSYDIPSSDNVEQDLVQSIAWSADEKYMAIGSENKILLLDLEKNSLSLVYVGPVDEDGNYYWDYSSLFLSSDASFIAFIDSNELTEEELSEEDAEIESLNTLKKVDLQNKTVSNLYSSEGLSLAL